MRTPSWVLTQQRLSALPGNVLFPLGLCIQKHPQAWLLSFLLCSGALLIEILLPPSGFLASASHGRVLPCRPLTPQPPPPPSSVPLLTAFLLWTQPWKPILAFAWPGAGPCRPPTFSTVCSCSPAGCLSCGRPHLLRGLRVCVCNAQHVLVHMHVHKQMFG